MRLNNAIKEAQIILAVNKKHGMDVEWQEGYLQALNDVNGGHIAYASKLDRIMRERCIGDTELGKAVKSSRQSINDSKIRGIKSRTKKARSIAVYFGVELDEIVEDKVS
jgi:hypothetical protein